MNSDIRFPRIGTIGEEFPYTVLCSLAERGVMHNEFQIFPLMPILVSFMHEVFAFQEMVPARGESIIAT